MKTLIVCADLAPTFVTNDIRVYRAFTNQTENKQNTSFTNTNKAESNKFKIKESLKKWRNKHK